MSLIQDAMDEAARRENRAKLFKEKDDALMQEALTKSAGLKFDSGKPPLDLLSRVWLEWYRLPLM